MNRVNNEEKCGGGGAGAIGRIEGREGQGEKVDAGTAGGECVQGGIGSVARKIASY